MGYHKRKIAKGMLGTASKIREEFEEFMDAEEQANTVMAVLELSDMLGAIEAYVSRYNMTLSDLIIMMKATQSAFKDGTRQPREQEWQCRRCGQKVDFVKFRCGCTTSPSPWEPIS